MITIRKSTDRGHADHGWLDTYHTFSFADYYDERFMGFRSLRVINEDWVAAAEGFGSHPHKDMEILTYVVAGRLRHKDSMGNEGVIAKGEVQKMSAGTGIIHSEFNGSQREAVHLLQIWVLPQIKGIKPSYQQMPLEAAEKPGLHLFADPQGGKNKIRFEQDIYVYHGRLSANEEVVHPLKDGRAAWVQIITGEVSLNGQHLTGGDGAAVEKEPQLALQGVAPSEFLLFDLK